MTRRRTIGLCVPLLAWASVATAAPGDLLIAERDSGSVLEFGQGGDLSKAERFATGLSAPLGLCVGPGGHIYVAETLEGGAAEITIITEGGDFTDAEPFATGPAAITDLLCDDERLFVAMIGAPPDKGDPPNGAVFDASGGGMFLFTGDAIALQLVLPGDFAETDDGSLFSANGDVWDITKGGMFGATPPFTTGRLLFTIAAHDEQLLGGDFLTPFVFDITEGGDVATAPIFAALPELGTGVHGLLSTTDSRLLALTGEHIFDITEGGDLTGAEPWATGLQTGQVGFHGMMEHVCSTDADCSDGDACNGDEHCQNNTCLPPSGPPQCEDDDVCTVDSCQPESGCSNEHIEGCCSADEQCAFDEFCDNTAHECVPVTAVTSGAGADETGADSSGGTAGPGSGQTGGEQTDTSGTDGAALDGSGDDGCSCRADRPDGAPWMSIPLLWLALRRRRRA